MRELVRLEKDYKIRTSHEIDAFMKFDHAASVYGSSWVDWHCSYSYKVFTCRLIGFIDVMFCIPEHGAVIEAWFGPGPCHLTGKGCGGNSRILLFCMVLIICRVHLSLLSDYCFSFSFSFLAGRCFSCGPVRYYGT